MRARRFGIRGALALTVTCLVLGPRLLPATPPDVVEAFRAVGAGTATPRQEALAFKHNGDLQAMHAEPELLPNGRKNPNHLPKSTYQANQGKFNARMKSLLNASAGDAGMEVDLSPSRDPKAGTDTDANLRGKNGSRITKGKWRQVRGNFNNNVREYLNANGVSTRGNENWSRQLDADIMPDPAHTDPETFREIADELNGEGGAMYRNKAAVDAQIKISKGGTLSVTEHQAYVEEMQHFASEHQSKADALQAKARQVAKQSPDLARRLDAEARIARSKAAKYYNRVNQANESLGRSYGIKPDPAEVQRGEADPVDTERGADKAAHKADTQRGAKSVREAAEVGALRKQLASKATMRASDMLAKVAQANPAQAAECRQAIARQASRLSPSQQGQLIEQLRVKYGPKMARGVAGEMRAMRPARPATPAPPSKIVKQGGKALLIYGIYQGYERAKEELANDTTGQYGDAYAVGKGMVLTVYHATGLSHSWDLGTQAGRESYQQYVQDIRDGKVDPKSVTSYAWMKTRAVGTGIYRFFKGMTFDAAWNTGTQLGLLANEIRQGRSTDAQGKALSDYADMERDWERTMVANFLAAGASRVGAEQAVEQMKKGNRAYARDLWARLQAKRAAREGRAEAGLPAGAKPARAPVEPARSFWDDLKDFYDTVEGAVKAEAEKRRPAIEAAWEEAAYQGPRNDAGGRVDPGAYQDGDMIMTQDGTEYILKNGEWRKITRDAKGKVVVGAAAQPGSDRAPRAAQKPSAGGSSGGRPAPGADSPPAGRTRGGAAGKTQGDQPKGAWVLVDRGGGKKMAPPQGFIKASGKASANAVSAQGSIDNGRATLQFQSDASWTEPPGMVGADGRIALSVSARTSGSGSHDAGSPERGFYWVHMPFAEVSVEHSNGGGRIGGVRVQPPGTWGPIVTKEYSHQSTGRSFLQTQSEKITWAPVYTWTEGGETRAGFKITAGARFGGEVFGQYTYVFRPDASYTNAPATNTAQTVTNEQVVVTATKAAAAQAPLYAGDSLTFNARLQTQAGAEPQGNYVLLWQPCTDVTFAPAETAGNASRTTATFSQAGAFRVWVEAYEVVGEGRKTAATSPPIELQVLEPEFQVAVSSATPATNEQVTARIQATGVARGTRFKWRLEGGGRQLRQSADTREMVFVCGEGKTITVIASGVSPSGGMNLGEARAEVVPKATPGKNSAQKTAQQQADAWIKQAEAAEAKGDLKGALDLFRQAQALVVNPRVAAHMLELEKQIQNEAAARALIDEGYAREQAGDVQGAIAKYRQSVVLMPNPKVSQHIAELEANSREQQRRTLIQAGEGLEKIKDLAGALKQYEAAQAIRADAGIAERVKRLKDVLDAEAKASQLIEQGYACEQKGDLYGAVKNYEESLALRPDRRVAERVAAVKARLANQEQAALQIKKGYGHEQAEEWSNALACYRRAQALEANPKVQERIDYVQGKIDEQRQLARAEEARKKAEAEAAQKQEAARRKEAARQAEIARQQEAARRAEALRQAEAERRRKEEETRRNQVNVNGTYVARQDGETLTFRMKQNGNRVSFSFSVASMPAMDNDGTGTIKGDYLYFDAGDEIRLKIIDRGNALDMESPDGTIRFKR